MSEEGAEVEIVREDDKTVLPRVGEDGGIRCCRKADFSPVHGVNACVAQPLNPARSEVHVEEELQDAAQ